MQVVPGAVSHMLAGAWLLIACLACGCGASDKAPYFQPAIDDGLAADGGSDGSAGGNGNVSDDASIGGGAPGSDSAAATEVDAGDPMGMLEKGAILFEADHPDGDCALHAVWNGKGQIGRRYPCGQDNHLFRRSDGARFFLSDGKIFQRSGSGSDSEIPTQCPVGSRFGFDADGHLYYRCGGGTTGPLYRDDKVIADNVVAELCGVLDDGRVFFQSFEDFHVLDNTGKEVSKQDLPSGYTALEESTTVTADAAYVLYVDSSTTTPRYVAMKYDATGWKEIAAFDAIEPPPGNFGNNVRVDPSGAVYVALDGKVRRYAADGSSKIIWEDSLVAKVSRSSETAFHP